MEMLISLDSPVDSVSESIIDPNCLISAVNVSSNFTSKDNPIFLIFSAIK